ncbi:hypothetical protein DCC39_12045 [Pueribacillus theae]|uniref:DNA-binding protein n=1 Tax=Pueribacillus theae TaxID=2171751 RepID=A0A2U1JXY4_9BACI|nr:hypothetical protein [Pueribacillus theae]PWA10012.1 hypothetical protein DCC39_12045 [Pueribacillus theae]
MDRKMVKEALDCVFTVAEARSLLQMSRSAFQQAVTNCRIKPLKEFGEGTGKVRLFFSPDVYEYKRTLDAKRKKNKR